MALTRVGNIGLATDKIYNTLSDVDLDNNLIPGVSVRTLGYTSVADGGDAEYVVGASGSFGAADDIFVIALASAGVDLKLVFDGTLRAPQAGIAAGGSDVTLSIQAALDALLVRGGGILQLLEGDYGISDTIEIPEYVTLRGITKDYTRLVALAGLENKPAVFIGRNVSGVPAFGARMERLEVFCSNLAGSVAARSNQGQEGSGISECRLRNTYGTCIDLLRQGPVGGGSINTVGGSFTIEDCELWVNEQTQYGVSAVDVGEWHLIRTTVLSFSGGSTAGRCAVYIEDSQCYIEGGHAEVFIDGVIIAGSSTVNIEDWSSTRMSATNSSAAVRILAGATADVNLTGVRNADSGIGPGSGLTLDNEVTGEQFENRISQYTTGRNNPALIIGSADNEFGFGYRDFGVAKWNAGASGPFLNVRGIEYRDSDNLDASNRCTTGLYSFATGDASDEWKVSTREAGGASFVDRFAVRVDGTGTIVKTAAWNDNPLRIGAWYLWDDGTNLRAKRSAPASAGDGSVVA